MSDINDLKGKSGAYILKDVISGLFYVGSTNDLNKRKLAHFSELSRNVHYNQNLQTLYNEGVDFTFIPLITENRELAFEKEQQLLDENKNSKQVLNISITAKGSSGFNYSEEAIKKMSEARLGIEFTEDHKKKLSEKKQFPVIVNGVEYHNASEAARKNNVSRRVAHWRINSESFPDWQKK